MSEEIDFGAVAAELTGSTSMAAAPEHDEALPNDLADAVEEFENHAAEKQARMDGAEPPAGEEPAEPGRKQVPLGALQQERLKRQELQTQLAAQQQQLAQLQQQQAQWQQWQAQQQAAAQQQQPAAETEAIPDFDEDPRGHIEALKEQFRRELGNLQQNQQVVQVQQQLQHEAATLGPVVADAEAQFAAENPSYHAAFNHVQANVEAQLQQMYPNANAAQMALVRTAAQLDFAKSCQARGMNPAQVIWDRAQQLGFTPGARTVQPAPRRQANTSLSNLAGAPEIEAGGALTGERLNSMDDAEFQKMFKDMARQAGANQRPRV